MSQIDLQKLTKKNQEFIHIATQQFIKDGKTDAEIKAILRKSFPKSLKSKPKGTTARSLYGAPTHWAHSFTVKEQYEKEHPKENDDPKLMIMDSALFITSLFALVSALTTFFAADQAFGYGFDHSPVGWTCWWICLLLDVLLCLPILWTRHGP